MNLDLLARDAYMRLERLRYLGRAKLDNLYLATVQKSGSQWMSAARRGARRMRQIDCARFMSPT